MYMPQISVSLYHATASRFRITCQFVSSAPDGQTKEVYGTCTLIDDSDRSGNKNTQMLHHTHFERNALNDRKDADHYKVKGTQFMYYQCHRLPKFYQFPFTDTGFQLQPY